MFRLIIVDDERLDREGLKMQINWETMNITTVETAKNGFEALDIIKEIKPDILITDIKMPGMNGLTLAEKAVELVPWIKVIIISGYDDFEYVRNAMKIKAYEYILKPVDTDELVIALKTIITERLKEKKAEEENRIMLDNMNVSKNILRNNLFLDIIYGSMEAANLWRRIQQLCLCIYEGTYYIHVIEVDDYKFLKEKRGRNECKSLIKKMEAVINRLKFQSCSLECQAVDECRLAVILSFYGEGCKDSEAVARNIAVQIIEAVKNECSISVSVGISSGVGGLEEIHDCYDRSCKALAQKIYSGKGSILEYYRKTNTDYESVDIQRVSNQLAMAIKNCDRGKADYLIDSFFEELMVVGVDSKRYILNCCINILSRIENVMIDLNDSIDNVFGQGCILWEELAEYETIQDIKEKIKVIFGQVIGYLQDRNKRKNRKVVDMVMKYIDANYSKELTLKDIAIHFYYSPNYLGALFKEELGKGFADYLAEVRMRNAAEVLRHTNVKIYEAANMVGYKNIPSFINQFKLIYKVTPKEYRERF